MTRIDQYREKKQQYEKLRFGQDAPDKAVQWMEWKTQLETLQADMAKLTKKMTPDERAEAGVQAVKPERNSRGVLKKAIIGGAIFTSGFAAARALDIAAHSEQSAPENGAER